MYILGIKSKE